jgi:DNA-binding beta-propeller fold protein YncE
MNFRVQVLDPEGEFQLAFGQPGNRIGYFSRPKGVAVDSEGHIYVVDAAFNNFQIFNPEGQLLLFVGQLGNTPGRFWLPAGAYIDGEDKLYVADQYNFRIQVFQYLRDQAAETANSTESPGTEAGESQVE